MNENIKIINMTPHAVNMVNELGELVATFEPEGLARCKQEDVVVGSIGDFPITKTSFGAVEGLPDEKEGVFFIVSRLVRQACADRHDLLVPNQLVRDEAGHIVGCKSFAID